jgi:hypothetical protein
MVAAMLLCLGVSDMADAVYADLFGSDILLHYDASDATSLFTDTACTTAASDGNEVKGFTPQADADLAINLTGTNGPAYAANYSSTGYPALVFDGSNDRLGATTTGLTGDRFFVIVAYTPISGSASTVWWRGSITRLARLLYVGTGATQTQLQTGINSSYISIGLPSGISSKVCVASDVGDAGFQLASLTNVVGNTADGLDNAMPETFYLGAGDNSGWYQGANIAFHEILLVGSLCEWGQVIRGAKIMRDKWGITDPNAMPQAPGGGGASFPPIGPGGLVY